MWAFIRQHSIFIATLILIVAGAIYNFKKGYESGCAVTEARWQSEYSKLLLHSLQLTEQAAELQNTIDTQSTEFERRSHEEKQTLITDYERRLADARNQRVYIPARIPTDYCDNAGAATAGAAPVIRETRCELDPTVVANLASIARDGDIAIIERNELIDRYNAARAALIQQKQQIKAP